MLSGTLALIVICVLFLASGSATHAREKGFLAVDQDLRLWNAFQENEVAARQVQEILTHNPEEDATETDDGATDQENDPVYPESSTPCSCECCQTQKMLPASFVRRLDGKMVTSKCWKPNSQQTSDDPQGAICPGTCQLSNDNKILTSAKGEVDYQRFCNYNCQPVADVVGAACVEFNQNFYKDAVSRNGNGKEVFPMPVNGINSGFLGYDGRPPPVQPDRPAADAAAPTMAPPTAAPTMASVAAAAKAKAKAEELAEEQRVKITYDMRKLITERLRSETGANVAGAAAAAERVRINRWSTKKQTKHVKNFRKRFAAIAGKMEATAAGVRASKDKADRSETKTKKDLVAGQFFATTMAEQVRKLADEAIKKAVGPCSEKAAEDRAEVKGLDKPANWVKVVAARAGDPYQKAVVAAVQRTSEYKHLADDLANQAYSAQKQANTLITHVNALEAQGDRLGATIEKKQVTDLQDKARTLYAEAAGYWNTAQNTHNTIPKWQMAAQQAAAYAAWGYSNNAQAYR